MATFNKVNDFVENYGEVMDVDGDTFIVALSNTAPASETNNPTTDTKGVLANVTQIAYTNLSARTLTLSSSAQASGTYRVKFNDLVLTSTGGSTGPFRYIYIYDDTPTSPADPLVCYYDYGSALTLANGESLTIDFDATNGLFSIA
jgi:hypothetical protein